MLQQVQLVVPDLTVSKYGIPIRCRSGQAKRRHFPSAEILNSKIQ